MKNNNNYINIFMTKMKNIQIITVKSSQNSLQGEMIHFMSVKSCEDDSDAVWLWWWDSFYRNIFNNFYFYCSLK